MSEWASKQWEPAPIVALYFNENLELTQRFIKDVLPTLYFVYSMRLRIFIEKHMRAPWVAENNHFEHLFPTFVRHYANWQKQNEKNSEAD